VANFFFQIYIKFFFLNFKLLFSNFTIFFFSPSPQLGGICVVSVSKALGGSLAFFAGRTIARDWVVHALEKHPRARAALAGVARNQLGTAFALRLSPMPSWVNNYGLAVTELRFSNFLLATVVGGLVFIVNNVSTGAGFSEAISAATGGGGGGVHYSRYVFTIGGILAATVVGKIVAQSSAATEVVEVEG
jgi:uncharacterized membrane protein YdjX (TVP38/TMEM64 family)